MEYFPQPPLAASVGAHFVAEAGWSSPSYAPYLSSDVMSKSRAQREILSHIVDMHVDVSQGAK